MFSPAGDVYAFGGVLIELFSEVPIWEGLTPFQIITKWWSWKKSRKSRIYPPEGQQICTQCFKSVQERLSNSSTSPSPQSSPCRFTEQSLPLHHPPSNPSTSPESSILLPLSLHRAELTPPTTLLRTASSSPSPPHDTSQTTALCMWNVIHQNTGNS
jgi:hypothetical protein